LLMLFSSKMKTIMARVRQDIWHYSTSFANNLMTILSKFNLWVQPNDPDKGYFIRHDRRTRDPFEDIWNQNYGTWKSFMSFELGRFSWKIERSSRFLSISLLIARN
jgi:hypothetical protein